MSVISRFWSWLIGEAKALPTIEQSIANFADKVANDIKKFTAPGSVGDYLLTGLTEVAKIIDPALVPLIAGIENYIPKVIALITGVGSAVGVEAGKTVEQQLEEGIAALENIKGIDGTVYAGLLATIQASLANYVHTNNAVAIGSVAPPASQLLAIGQAVHTLNNEATANAPIATALAAAETAHDQPAASPAASPAVEEESPEEEVSDPDSGSLTNVDANTAPTSEAPAQTEETPAQTESAAPAAQEQPVQTELSFEEAIKQEKIKLGLLNEDGTPITPAQ